MSQAQDESRLDSHESHEEEVEKRPKKDYFWVDSCESCEEEMGECIATNGCRPSQLYTGGWNPLVDPDWQPLQFTSVLPDEIQGKNHKSKVRGLERRSA